ncbi:hypothetical protein ACFOHL_12525 [Agaribacter flavus]|uniref:Uncharacterized protein n=1 Tax=Agaribacter flavus TaxID=1902781 RepID=A0ABV7FSL3_9ALTE
MCDWLQVGLGFDFDYLLPVRVNKVDLAVHKHTQVSQKRKYSTLFLDAFLVDNIIIQNFPKDARHTVKKQVLSLDKSR